MVGAGEEAGEEGGEDETGDETGDDMDVVGVGEMAAMEALEMNSPTGMNWNEMSSEGSMKRCSWSRPLVQFIRIQRKREKGIVSTTLSKGGKRGELTVYKLLQILL